MTSAGDYVAMCKALLDNVRWFDASPVGSPAGSPFDTDQLAAAVRTQQAQLPACYRTAYAAPLLAALPDLVAQLRQQVDRSLLLGAASTDALAEVRSIADTLAAGAGKLDALPPALRPVWTTWIDEAASDVYGILNIGPAFAVSLAAGRSPGPRGRRGSRSGWSDGPARNARAARTRSGRRCTDARSARDVGGVPAVRHAVRCDRDRRAGRLEQAACE
jgi:hypothetical protein